MKNLKIVNQGQGPTIPRPLDVIDGLTPEVVEARLKRQADLRDAFLGYVRGQMKPGVHFMQLPGKNARPYLKQEGALLLKDFYECSDDYEVVKETIENDFYAITIKCYLTHPSGMVYTGLGWANSREYNFQVRIEESARKVIEAKETKLSPEMIREGFYYTQFETVQQFARKRSLVSSARHLPFVSELFTSKGDDEPAEGKQRGGVSRNSREGLKEKYDQRLRTLMSWFKSEGVEEDREIKERLSNIVGQTVNSKSMFVHDDEQWDKFCIYINEVKEARAHGQGGE